MVEGRGELIHVPRRECHLRYYKKEESHFIKEREKKMHIARNSRTRGGRRRVCRSPNIQAVPICVCVTQSVRQVGCGAADGWMDDSARLCILDRRRRKGNPNCDLSHLNGCRADADCRSLSLSPFLVMYVQTSERHDDPTGVAWFILQSALPSSDLATSRESRKLTG